MNISPIKTEADNENALVRIEQLMMIAEPDTEAGDELEILATLVESFEEKTYPIDAPDPVQAIRFRMEQQELGYDDLVPYLGQRSRVTEILKYQRRLSINMIRKLHEGLKIPLECLIREYPLVN